MACMWFDVADPTGAPVNVTSEVISSTSIYVMWEEILPIERNGIITEYVNLFVKTLSPGSINTTDLNVIILGLEEFIFYNIFVRAYTSVGPGPYSVPITNQTLQDCEFTIFQHIHTLFIFFSYSAWSSGPAA